MSKFITANQKNIAMKYMFGSKYIFQRILLANSEERLLLRFGKQKANNILVKYIFTLSTII